MKVIIIHGSKTYFGKPNKRNLTYLLAKKMIGTDPNFNYAKQIKDYLIKNKVKCRIFYWGGDIWLWRIKKEANKLAQEIKKAKQPVIIFAKSNGGIIAQLASKRTNLIKKIVQIGCPNLSIKPLSKTKIINVYSKEDNIQRRGIILNSILNLSRGSRTLKGNNVKNIILRDINHRDFNSKKMFDFYYKLIK
ncbi:hypothetical protein FJZ17_01520 [Candidatus Pacearchaeota archaeon]|nr:hypothetical protein [Candidatus Pacearchaeota archaeon]